MEPPRTGRRPAVEPGPSAAGPPRKAVLLAALIAALAGTWQLAPALGMGFHMDDFVHLGVIQGGDVLPQRGPFHMFDLVVAEPERMGPVQGDYLPWWTDEDLSIRFLRPLSSLSFYLDHLLFGADPVAFHASSLVWYAALVVAVVLVFGELARRSRRSFLAVLLAGLFFALASEHESSAGWISARYTLVAVLLCVPTLLFYVRWRSGGERRHLLLALLGFALALLAGETSAALVGYLLAYELTLARDRWRDRVAGLLPVLVLLLVWAGVYAATGHGTHNSSWYVDPLREPATFLSRGLGAHLPVGVQQLVLPAGLEQEFAAGNAARLSALLAGVGVALPPWPVVEHQLYGPGLLLLLGAVVLHAVRDRTTRFALLGALLALVPLSAATASKRALLLPSIGMAWVLGALVADALRVLARPRALVRPWSLVRVALAAVFLWGLHSEWHAARARLVRRTNAAHGLVERASALELPEGEAAQGTRVLLLTVPTTLDILLLPVVRLQQGRGWPEGIWGISLANGRHELLRTGERSFRLRVDPEDAPLGFILPDYFRRGEVAVGDVMRCGVLSVTVAETSGRRVDAIDVRIDLPLDDPDVWLVAWEGYRWKRIAAPPVGESVEIRTRHVPWSAPPGTLQALRSDLVSACAK